MEKRAQIIDISVPVTPGLPVWPGDPRVVLERFRKISAGSDSNDSKMACSVHCGTHVDAPAHFVENGSTIEDLGLDILIGPAAVAEFPEIDVITPDLLENQKLPPGTKRLLLKTKNSDLWTDPEHTFHTDFVALNADAAAWMVEREIRLVGIDYLSIQLFRDAEPQTHRTLLEAGVVIVEGLNLQKVSPGCYQFICLPLKLAGSEGAPARAVLIQD